MTASPQFVKSFQMEIASHSQVNGRAPMGAIYCPEQHFFYRELGTRVKKHRLAARLSMEDLAFQSNVSRTTIASLERGNLKISVYLLIRLLITIGMSSANLDDILMSARRKNGRKRLEKPEKADLSRALKGDDYGPTRSN